MGIFDVNAAGVASKITRIYDVNATGMQTRLTRAHDISMAGVASWVYPDLCTITARSPTSVVANAGTTITLTGTGFYSATSVRLNGPNVNVTPTIESDTKITFKMPSTTFYGSVSVLVVNSRGNSNAMTVTTTRPNLTMSKITLAAGGSPPGDWGNRDWLSTSSWNLSDVRSVTLTVSYCEANIEGIPAPNGCSGSCWLNFNNSASIYVGPEFYIYDPPRTYTLNLTPYSNAQKAVTKLGLHAEWSAISTVTGSRFTGGCTASGIAYY